LARSGPDGVNERFALGKGLLELGTRTGNRQEALWGRLWRFDALLQLGQIDAAEGELGPIAALAGHLRQPLAHWHHLRSRATIAFARGRFDETIEFTRQVLAQAERGRHEGGAVAATALTVVVCAQTGSDLPPDLRSQMLEWEVMPMPAVSLGSWHLAAGNLAEARRLFAGLPEADEVQAFLLLPYIAARTEFADAFGDRDCAADAYQRLLPFADLFVCGGAGAVAVSGSARLPLGVAAATVGRLDDAVRHLRAAVKANDLAGTPPFSAWSRYELARVLARRKHAKDRDEAAALAASAAAQAQRLGMAPLVHKARKLSQSLAGTTPGPLTPARA
jgi:tetratricopeptide (TPR) repeat protein